MSVTHGKHVCLQETRGIEEQKKVPEVNDEDNIVTISTQLEIAKIKMDLAISRYVS